MRFADLTLPAFGPFTDLSLSFPHNGTDFHLIYGPNEAGKSSLLRAIRDLLYGIHGQTADNFLHDYGNLRIVATLVNSNGQQLRCQRRKGNKNTLLDMDGNALADDALAPYLGSVDRDFFTAVFGLGIEELRRGAEVLLQGKGELGQALFAASLAGTPVHQVLAALEKEAQGLYAIRARKNISIHEAIKAQREHLSQSKAVAIKPEAWDQTLGRLQEAQARLASLNEALRQGRTRRDWLQRCLDALPTLGQLAEQEAKLAALPSLPSVDEPLSERAEAAIAERDRARLELTQLAARLQQLNERLATHAPNAAVLARAAEIEALHARRELHRQHQTTLAREGAQLQQQQAALSVSLQNLGLDGGPSAAESLRVEAAAGLALKAAAAAYERAAQALQSLRCELQRLTQERTRLVASLSDQPPEELAALRADLAATAAAASLVAEMPKRRQAFAEAERRLQDQRRLLGLLPGDLTTLFTLPVPKAATVRRFEAERAEIGEGWRQGEEALSALQRRLADLATERERLLRGETLPSLADLAAAREQRDQGWAQLLAAWQQGEAPAPFHETYPAAVVAADSLADQLRRDAVRVAQRDELELQRQRLLAELAEVEARQRQRAAALAAWEERWQALWAPCGLSPQTPAEMLEWRDEWLTYCRRYEERQQAQAALTGAEAAIAEAAMRLGGDGAASLAALRAEAEERIQRSDEARGARQQRQQRLTDLDAELCQRQGEEPALAAAYDAALARWRAQCQRCGLLSDDEPAAALALFEQRQQAVALFDEWRRCQQVVAVARTAVEEFAVAVQHLADEVGLPEDTVERREGALWASLEEAAARRAQQRQIQSDLAQEQQHLSEAQQRLTAAEEAIARCVEQLGVSDEEALQRMLTQLKEQRCFNTEIARLQQTLHGVARGEPLDQFIARVRSEAAEELISERQELDQRLTALEAERDQAVQCQARIEDEKRQLEQADDTAVNHRQMAEAKAVQIRRDSARYLRLKLAVHLLQRQIERYRQENQAPLLSRASELFVAMTEQRFEGLQASVASDDTPIIVGLRQGREVPVAGMSDGTRDQLYLALRLAALERHQARHEPMPIIMDDLLITFDERRTQILCGLLRELSRQTQVLLFTHHQHVVDRARETFGGDELSLHSLA